MSFTPTSTHGENSTGNSPRSHVSVHNQYAAGHRNAALMSLSQTETIMAMKEEEEQ